MTSPKPVGFDAVRCNVHLDADVPQKDIDDLMACKSGHLYNTFMKRIT